MPEALTTNVDVNLPALQHSHKACEGIGPWLQGRRMIAIVTVYIL